MTLLRREDIESLEHERLSQYAAFSDESLGRLEREDKDPYRTCYQRDRDRILHSKSFRRLANKTQAFLAPEGDHFRTRLTHTLEVSQIARDIARPLGLNEDLTEAIALGHDLGHTPFGHAGERAIRKVQAERLGLDAADKDIDGLFRHNEQSVRVTRLYERDGRGLNLSFEVTDGMSRHTGRFKPLTLEGRVVARADRIAYVCHDIDDAERAGLLSEEALPAHECEILGHGSSERIATMVEDVIASSAGIDDIVMSPGVDAALQALRAYLFKNLYRTGISASEDPKAEHVVASLYTYFLEHVEEVPSEYQHTDGSLEVRVADYVSSMTDRFATRLYKDLFVPKVWGLR